MPPWKTGSVIGPATTSSSSSSGPSCRSPTISSSTLPRKRHARLAGRYRRARTAGDRLRGVTEVVRSRQFGRVAVVELHRPQVRHAMDTHLLDELIAALRSAARAGDTDAVVVTGSDGCFSSGADVSEDIDRAAAQARMGRFGALYELVATYPVPTVAAISGW